MTEPHYINTIEELYQWAKENGYENYQLFISDDGKTCNIILEKIEMYERDKEIIIWG